MAAVCFDRSPAVVFKRFPSFFDIFGAHSSNERWMFLVTYFCITLGILLSTLQATLLANHPEGVKLPQSHRRARSSGIVLRADRALHDIVICRSCDPLVHPCISLIVEYKKSAGRNWFLEGHRFFYACSLCNDRSQGYLFLLPAPCRPT